MKTPKAQRRQSLFFFFRLFRCSRDESKGWDDLSLREPLPLLVLSPLPVGFSGLTEHATEAKLAPGVTWSIWKLRSVVSGSARYPR